MIYKDDIIDFTSVDSPEDPSDFVAASVGASLTLGVVFAFPVIILVDSNGLPIFSLSRFKNHFFYSTTGCKKELY